MKKRTAGRRCLGLLMACVLCLNQTPMKARSADKDVYLVDAEGSVSLENAAGRALKHFNNMKLQNGSRVKTGWDGRVRFGIGENGELILESCGNAELRASKSIPEFLMDRGAVSFDLTESSITMNVRTSIAAVTVENAKGRIYIQDRNHTLICMEEGELRCSVADPVSGQVKTARLTGKKTAECAIYPKGEKGKYCDILIRELREEDRVRNTVCNGEEQQLSAFHDPVWEDDFALADAAKAEEAVPQEDDNETQDSSENQGTKYYPGIYLPPSMPLPYVPLEWENALAENRKPASSDSDHGAGSGTGSAASSASGSGSGSTQPGTASPAPSGPETTSPAPTEDRGLVLNIAKNGEKGRIEVNNGGKVVVQNKELLNEGTIEIDNQGIIEGEIINDNEYSYFILGENNGKVTRVSNTSKGGSIILHGGTVEEGVRIEGGTVEIDKTAAIKASESLKTLEVVSTSGTSPKIIYNREGDSSTWDSSTWTDGKGLLYITRKDTGGLVELCGLRDEFSGAVEDINDRAHPGDTITLSGTVIDMDTAAETVTAKGGTKNEPILLDLHGYALVMQRFAQGNYTDGTICFDNKAAWRLENGSLTIAGRSRSIHIKDSGKLTLSGIRLSGDLCNYDSSKLTVTNTEITGGSIYNCYNSECFILDKSVFKNPQSVVYNYNGGRMNISDVSGIIGDIINGDGASFTPAVVTDEMKKYEDIPSQLAISESTVANIQNSGVPYGGGIAGDKADNYADNTIVKVKASMTGSIVNNTGRVELSEGTGTGDISNSGGIVTVSNSIVGNLNNDENGILEVSSRSTIKLDEYIGSVSRSSRAGGIGNRSGSRCVISDSTIQMKDGNSRIYNAGIFCLSNSGIDGEVSIENEGGKLDISEPNAAIKGMINTSYGGACTLTRCDLIVIDQGIVVSGSELYIDGGTYHRESAYGESATISINAYSPQYTSVLRIGGGAELNENSDDGGNGDDDGGVIPIYLTTYGNSLGAFDITIDKATIKGGNSSVLRSEFNGNYGIADGAERKLTVNEGAALSSKSANGTIAFHDLDRRNSPDSSAWNLKLELNGGSIINENEGRDNGFALSFGKVNDENELLRNVSFGEIGAELRATTADPIVWLNMDSRSKPYYPDGYTFSYNQEEGYVYLVKSSAKTASDTTLSILSDESPGETADSESQEDELFPSENLTDHENTDPASPSNVPSLSIDTGKEENALSKEETEQDTREEVKLEGGEDSESGDNLK